ncbi:MAG: zeta toxin family protein [Clostridia bacterium]|nr:zeta toxin family protein [Clostridia bacterium]
MAELYITELLDKLKDPALAIAEAEAAYERRITEVAERVVSDGSIRVLLLAGPSGSGKTTTANLISDKIKSLGERSMVVSLDDFYRSTTDPD